EGGAYIVGGSDFPVEDANPFHGLHAAVTRRPRAGDDPRWQPGQRMTRDEAVRAFTTWNARSIGLERDQGSLEGGRRADLIALDDDPFTCAETAIADLAPRLTMIGRETVSGNLQKSGRERQRRPVRKARHGIRTVLPDAGGRGVEGAGGVRRGPRANARRRGARLLVGVDRRASLQRLRPLPDASRAGCLRGRPHHYAAPGDGREPPSPASPGGSGRAARRARRDQRRPTRRGHRPPP